MRDAYSTQELLPVAGCSKATLLARAKRENWPSRQRTGRGGGFEFPVETLPEDVRLKILAAEAERSQAVVPVQGTTKSVPLDEARRRKAAARLDLVALYRQWLLAHGKGADVRESFINAYRAGAWPQLLEIVGSKVSWKTLERWKVAASRECSLAAVADKRGIGKRGKRSLTGAQQQMLIRFCLQADRPISEAYREANVQLAFEGHERIGSEATARRFIQQDWAPRNFGDWVFIRKGEKAWNDQCAFFIERDYDLIGVGDILVADGHKLNFEIINPETGKPQRMEMVLWYDMKSNCPLGWEIMPSENTQCIAAAFRRACLMLGKFPKVAYLDNGRAFRGKYFNGVDMRQTGVGGLFAALGVRPLFAWPYHGQSKTVERFFKSFAELERWAPSYSGTSIATKPPRMMRGERTHRAIYEAAGGRPLTIPEAHAAIAKFFDEYAKRPQRGHLNGQSPWDVFRAGMGPGLTGDQIVQLRDLMLTKEVRKIHRNGVSLFGRNYYAPLLYGRNHQVEVRYDALNRDGAGDVEHVLVYETDGTFLCRADKVCGVHPAASILGDEGHVRDFQAAIALKKAQQKEASTMARTMLQAVVLPETAERMKAVAVEEEAPAVPESKPLSQAKIKAIESVKAQAREAQAAAPTYTLPAERAEIRSELDKYEYLFGVSVRDGITLRDADREWMEQYEQTEEFAEVAASRYARLRDFYARQRGTKMQEVSA